MANRRLLLFPHSHFCEKARWALDYKSVPYEVEVLLPGLHMLRTRRLAKATTVPILLDGNVVVQGADRIISHLDQSIGERILGAFDEADRENAAKFERDIDSSVGAPLRQIAYSYLLNYPEYCQRCFVGSESRIKQVMFKAGYPALKKLMHQAYVGSDASVAKAKDRIFKAFDQLDELLEGQQYLYSGRFTRADLSLASLLSIAVQPDEHPFDWPAIPSDELIALIDRLKGRPTFQWAERIYAQHR